MTLKANKDKARFVSNIISQDNGVKATATVEFLVNPNENWTIVLNGTTFRFKGTVEFDNDVLIAGTIAGTIDNLISEVNLPSEATYTRDGDNLVIEYGVIGTVGDAYTISSAYFTVPATLTGGSYNPEGDWVDHEVITKYKLPEIVLEDTTTNLSLETLDLSAVENMKVLFTEADNTITEATLGPITLVPGSTFISVAKTGTTGEIIIPQDGTVAIAMAGGGGSGCGSSTTSGSGGGGGGSALLIQDNISVSAGQTIPFTIGAGGAGTAYNIIGKAGGSTSCLGFTASGGGPGVNAGAGAGTNGGGAGGSYGNQGSPGVGFQFSALDISIAGVAGVPGGRGGSYGGGGAGRVLANTNGANGQAGTFGGGGNCGNYPSGSSGAGGAGYIYIAYKQDISAFDITSFGLSIPPTKAYFNKTIDTTLSAEDTDKCKSSTVTQIGVL